MLQTNIILFLWHFKIRKVEHNILQGKFARKKGNFNITFKYTANNFVKSIKLQSKGKVANIYSFGTHCSRNGIFSVLWSQTVQNDKR